MRRPIFPLCGEYGIVVKFDVVNGLAAGPKFDNIPMLPRVVFTEVVADHVVGKRMSCVAIVPN